MKPFEGEMVPVEYKLCVAGKYQDPMFQQYKAAVEYLAETRDNVSACVEGYFETQFEQRLRQIVKQYEGAFRQAKPTTAIIWGETDDNKVLYFGDPQKFFAWASKRFKYEDNTNRALYKRLANKAHRKAMEESGRSFATIAFQVGGEPPESVTFEFFDEECPDTCDKFMKVLEDPAFHGSAIHRIKAGAWIQGGDLVDGSGANSSVEDFRDESFRFKHDRPGLIGLANKGYADTNGSQFYITLKEMPFLDGRSVLFGRVVSGMRTILRIARLETQNERPVVDVRASCSPDQLEVTAPARDPVAIKKQPKKLTKEEQEEAAAATKVQSLYRGKRDKKKVQELKEEKAAATKVQSLYRGNKDRKAIQEKKQAKRGSKVDYGTADDLAAPA